MSPKKTKAPTKKRPKQLGLGEGYERKKIPAIEETGDDLVDVQDEIKTLNKKAKELEATMATLVGEHGFEKYVYTDQNGDEITVRAESKRKVTVKRKKAKKAKE